LSKKVRIGKADTGAVKKNGFKASGGVKGFRDSSTKLAISENLPAKKERA